MQYSFRNVENWLQIAKALRLHQLHLASSGKNTYVLAESHFSKNVSVSLF